VSFQDIANGLITDRIAEMGQGADYTIVPPGPILSGQAHHQGFQLRIDRRAPWRPAFLRAVELLGDELAMPGQNGVGLDKGDYFRQRPFSKLLADLGQGPALAIGQSHTACDPIPKDAVFGHQIFVPQQQLLIDGPCDGREQRFPAHTPLHLRSFCPYEREV
jgi:hypothetical protein